MISTPNPETAIALIDDAATADAQQAMACAELEIGDRTLLRWTKGREVHADQRPLRSRQNHSAAQ
jgi:hypothetical protein